MQAAFKACAADLPRGGFRGRFNSRPRRAAITQFVTCVRKHGYNLPAPNLSGTGPVFPSKIESNAKFQAASRSCRNLLCMNSETQSKAPNRRAGRRIAPNRDGMRSPAASQVERSAASQLASSTRMMPPLWLLKIPQMAIRCRLELNFQSNS